MPHMYKTYLLEESLYLDSNTKLNNIQVAYETYGSLNDTKSNAILICHALSGSSHVTSTSKTEKKGWWQELVGPDKAIDTNKYFVICSNVLGSCYGTTGPKSINTETNKAYGLSFPVITISDMVKVQEKLISHLNISKLEAVIGGSMGGMQALEWSIQFPKRINKCIAIATTPKQSPQSLAFGAVSRNAITSDINWKNGEYYQEQSPLKGLSIARMIGHITYLSEEGIREKFGRNLQDKSDFSYELSHDFQIESYLKYQGDKFINIFDANSYLYLSKAMSYFDLEKKYESLENAFTNTDSNFLIVSISSDWLYPSKESKLIVKTLMNLNKPVSYTEIDSPYGHDAFLIDIKKLSNIVKPFLEFNYE